MFTIVLEQVLPSEQQAGRADQRQDENNDDGDHPWRHERGVSLARHAKLVAFVTVVRLGCALTLAAEGTAVAFRAKKVAR